MMDVVSREPVDPAHLHLEVIDRPPADVCEFQRVCVVGTLIAHGANQACAALASQRKEPEEIGLIEVDVQLTVERRTCSFDIGDIKHLSVGATDEPRADDLAHARTRAVAPGHKGRLAPLLLAGCAAQPRNDAASSLRVAEQLGASLYDDTHRTQSL